MPIAFKVAIARLVMLILIAVLGVVLHVTEAKAVEIPALAGQHRDTFEREAVRVFGINAPLAALAAQIHVESHWNCRAVSRVGAKGCAQFMPKTAAWMPELARDLAGGDPFDPRWAFRAQSVYMARLIAQTKPMGEGLTECARFAFAARDYNGGQRNTLRDRERAKLLGINPDGWRAVSIVNGAARGPGAFLENTKYPVRILIEVQPAYARAAWGRAIDCSAKADLSKVGAKRRRILVLRQSALA